MQYMKWKKIDSVLVIHLFPKNMEQLGDVGKWGAYIIMIQPVSVMMLNWTQLANVCLLKAESWLDLLRSLSNEVVKIERVE